MIYASQFSDIGTEGYIIHNQQVVPVTVSGAQDISYHGSEAYRFTFNEVEGLFMSMYSQDELELARETLRNIILKDIRSVKQEIKDLQLKLHTLKQGL